MEQKTRVLFFIESLAGGGAEKVLSTIVDHIDKERFDVTVSSVTAEGVYVEQVSKTVKYKPLIGTRNTILYKILYHLIYFYLPLRWVYKLFIPKGNDVEVAFCEGFATKLLARSPAKRKIAWVHIDLLANPWTQKTVYSSVEEEKQVYAKYNGIMCVSDHVNRSFESNFGIAAQTMYNPIDSDEIIKKSKAGVSLPPKIKMRFVTAGRLVEQKGYDRLLKVVKKLKDESCDFELWILGDGADRNALISYISENNLGSYVKLWGFIPNPYPYIAAGDVFVCSSRSEGYSTVATEALILGVPVITTHCSGMEELLGNDSQCGFIVDNEDMALFDPLKKVITDPACLEKLKRNAAQRGSNFRIEFLMTPIECLLK